MNSYHRAFMPPNPYAHAKEMTPADMAQAPQEDGGPLGMLGGLLGGGGKGGSGGGDYMASLQSLLSSAFGG